MIADVLFPAADRRRTVLSILQWWEARRLLYNGIVGGAGLITLAVGQVVTLLPGELDFRVPWQAVVAYGVLANIAYTLGWAVEAGLQKLWGPACPPVGPALFRQGLAFSVGLTLLPIGVMSLGWVVNLLKFIL